MFKTHLFFISLIHLLRYASADGEHLLVQDVKALIQQELDNSDVVAVGELINTLVQIDVDIDSSFERYLKNTVIPKLNLQKATKTDAERQLIASTVDLINSKLVAKTSSQGDANSAEAYNYAQLILEDYEKTRSRDFHACKYSVKSVKVYDSNDSGEQYVEFVAKPSAVLLGFCPKIECKGSAADNGRNPAKAIEGSCNDEGLNIRAMPSEHEFQLILEQVDVQLKDTSLDAVANGWTPPTSNNNGQPAAAHTREIFPDNVIAAAQTTLDAFIAGQDAATQENIQDCVYHVGGITASWTSSGKIIVEFNAAGHYQECMAFQCAGKVSGTNAQAVNCNYKKISDDVGGIYGTDGSEARAISLDANARATAANLALGYKQSQDATYQACEYRVRNSWDAVQSGDNLNMKFRMKPQITLDGTCAQLLCVGEGTATSIAHVDCDFELMGSGSAIAYTGGVTLSSYDSSTYVPRS